MSQTRRVKHFLSLALVAAVAACAGEEVSEEPEEAPAAQPEQVELEMPGTDGAEVWSYIQAAEYQNWPMWPDKGAMYPGGEPHGALLTTYVNEAALEAVNGQTGSLPVGSMVIKENFMPDSTLAAVTVMYKVEGYNPENNDWWFAKYLADGSLDQMNGNAMEGMVPGCTNCHGGVRDNDFIFTSPLSSMEGGG